MKKIYVVIEDYAYNGDEEIRPLRAFTSEEKAIAFLENEWELFKNTNEWIFPKCDTIEEYDTIKMAWRDGDYLDCHQEYFIKSVVLED